jgi:hypothetical protein
MTLTRINLFQRLSHFTLLSIIGRRPSKETKKEKKRKKAPKISNILAHHLNDFEEKEKRKTTPSQILTSSAAIRF